MVAPKHDRAPFNGRSCSYIVQSPKGEELSYIHTKHALHASSMTVLPLNFLTSELN